MLLYNQFGCQYSFGALQHHTAARWHLPSAEWLGFARHRHLSPLLKLPLVPLSPRRSFSPALLRSATTALFLDFWAQSSGEPSWQAGAGLPHGKQVLP